MDAKKTAAALGFVLLALSGTAVGQGSYIVRPDVTDCVHVRDDASPDANVVACLAAGAAVSVLSSRPYWREVDIGQPEPDWIAKRNIVPSPTPPVVPVPAPLPDNMWLTVHFIDVGQGDAIWIHTADDSIDGNGIFEGKNIVVAGVLAWIVVLTVLGFEVWAGVHWLGERSARFDLSSELRP